MSFKFSQLTNETTIRHSKQFEFKKEGKSIQVVASSGRFQARTIRSISLMGSEESGLKKWCIVSNFYSFGIDQRYIIIFKHLSFRDIQLFLDKQYLKA